MAWHMCASSKHETRHGPERMELVGTEQLQASHAGGNRRGVLATRQSGFAIPTGLWGAPIDHVSRACSSGQLLPCQSQASEAIGQYDVDDAGECFSS